MHGGYGGGPGGGAKQDRVTLDDLARLYDLLVERRRKRYYKRWEVETRNTRKRTGAVVQDDTRLQRIKDRAEGIRYALGYEDLTIRQRKELEQTLRNLELAITGVERDLGGKRKA
jgi:hypothetical protein